MPESECKTNKHYKDMQTIKVSIEPTANGYEFCNGNTAVASIREYKHGTFNLMAAHKPFGHGDFVRAVSLCKRFKVVSRNKRSFHNWKSFNNFEYF